MDDTANEVAHEAPNVAVLPRQETFEAHQGLDAHEVEQWGCFGIIDVVVCQSLVCVNTRRKTEGSEPSLELLIDFGDFVDVAVRFLVGAA